MKPKREQLKRSRSWSWSTNYHYIPYSWSLGERVPRFLDYRLIGRHYIWSWSMGWPFPGSWIQGQPLFFRGKGE
jgi:hypothetical protein